MNAEENRQDRRSRESYTWPLVAIVVVILPQLLIPSRYRVGPPVLVPIIESIAFLVMLAIAAKPGQRAAEKTAACRSAEPHTWTS